MDKKTLLKRDMIAICVLIFFRSSIAYELIRTEYYVLLIS